MIEKPISLTVYSSEKFVVGNEIISFLNPASIGLLLNSQESNREINYYIDGILLCYIIKILTKKKIDRISFDFTSIASKVLSNAEKSRKTMYFLGATTNEIELFINKITNKHPMLVIGGFSDGYFTEENENKLVDDIITSGTDIAVIGLGAGKQERFASILHKSGFKGTTYTCGGFIRQESGTSKEYYPKIINTLNLRFIYRMYKEPYTVRRYLLDYPKNIFQIFKSYKNKSLKIDII